MKLNNRTLNLCGDFILKEGRQLEKELYKHFFLIENSSNVLHAISHYQNHDGGFGHGIEPDALLPLSSPYQTAVGLSYLKNFDDKEEAKIMINRAIQYFESTYRVERKGWISLPKEVNLFPHTIWWEYDVKKQLTLIDLNYGNPTAEIIAYLVRYKHFITTLDVFDLVNHVIEYIENKNVFNSEHELYCFIKLYHELDGPLKNRLEKQITKGIHQLIIYDREKWMTTYVPTPLSFVNDPSMNYFGIDQTQVDINLDFFIHVLTEDHKIMPSWGENFYSDDFKKSYSDWSVIKTLESLTLLKRFNCIELS